MSEPKHQSATASHYDEQAESYDSFDQDSQIINTSIEKILKEHHVKTVLDFTCGTGSQLFWLADRGYHVTGVDISSRMLQVARKKASEANKVVTLIEGDMRSTKVGTFDAVITIFNAVGHLTKADFEKAMRNIGQNLNANGLYLFDIFNTDYLLHGDNITQLTIDWQSTIGNSKVRKIQYSTIDHNGVLYSHTTLLKQVNDRDLEKSIEEQTLQVYRKKELEQMLERNSFALLHVSAIDGSPFIETETDRMLVLAKKQ